MKFFFAACDGLFIRVDSVFYAAMGFGIGGRERSNYVEGISVIEYKCFAETYRLNLYFGG